MTTNKTLIGLNYLAHQITFLIEYCLSWRNRYHSSSFPTVKQDCQNQAVFVGLTFISLPPQVGPLAMALFHINRAESKIYGCAKSIEIIFLPFVLPSAHAQGF